VGASYLNDAGQVVGKAQFFLNGDTPPQLNCDGFSGIYHSGWYVYSPPTPSPIPGTNNNGGMTFPWGVDGQLLTNSQGIRYNHNETYVFGLDNNGLLYANSGFSYDYDNGTKTAYFSNGRFNADGTITQLPEDLNNLSRVTLDGRSIVTATWGGLEVYRLNGKTGSFDGPTVVQLTLPTGSSGSAGGGGTYGAQADYIDGGNVRAKWVNNRLQFLVAGQDAAGPHSYIYQVVNSAAVMVGDLGPGSVATAINEVGWATGYFADGSGNPVSNFIYRPQQKKFEIFNPPPPSQYFDIWTMHAGELNGKPIPFGITNGGTVAITLSDINIDAFGNTQTIVTTVQRTPDGIYTSVGNGVPTLFPAQYGPYYTWTLVGFQQNEQGQIAGTGSWAQSANFDPVTQTWTSYGIGHDSWLWY
jgi:hypothetical protein